MESAVTPARPVSLAGPRARLRRLRVAARLAIVAQAVAASVTAFAIFASLDYGIDRWLRLEVGYRAVLLTLLVLVLLRLVWRHLLRPLRQPLSEVELALAVERADGASRQALISAVQFEDALARQARVGDGDSPALMRAVIADVARRSDALPFAGALDLTVTRRRAVVGALALAVLGGWAAAAPGTLRLWAARNLLLSSAEWPRATQLAFVVSDAGELRVARGDDLAVVVQAGGEVPDEVTLQTKGDPGGNDRVAMTRVADDRFEVTLPAVLEPLTVVASGGDATTTPLTVRILEHPRLTDLRVVVTPPTYTGRQPTELVEPSGDLAMPRGSHVTITAHCDKRLRRAELSLHDGSVALAVQEGQRALGGTFTPTDSGLATLHLTDVDGLDAAQPPAFSLRLIDDTPPAITTQAYAIGATITPAALVPLQVAVRDDYGIGSLALEMRVTEVADTAGGEDALWRPTHAAELRPLVAGAREHHDDVVFDLMALPASSEHAPAVPPGRILSLRWVATDRREPSPQTGVSEVLSFRVIARDALVAELERRQDEQRRELERVVVDVRAGRAVARDIVLPAADAERAPATRDALAELARTQRALGAQTRGIADRYRQILAELRNNRIVEPGTAAGSESLICDALVRVADERFPATADRLQALVNGGNEDVRGLAMQGYDAILKALDAVLARMQRMESFATLLEDLRRVIELQGDAMQAAEQNRTEAAGSLFDPIDESGALPSQGADPKERR